jgi:hypothetical protein
LSLTLEGTLDEEHMGILHKIFGCQKSDPDSLRPITRLQAEKIIQDYGAVLARSDLTRGGVADTGKLPHPKERIKEALVFALRSTKEPQTREQLKSGYIFLAHYQEGVGGTTDGLDLTKPDLNLDPAELTKWWPFVYAEIQALKSELEKQGLW